MPLQQVLFNLIMNAIEAMSAVTERERQLMIRAVPNERANVRVTVEDTSVELTRLTSTASSTLSLRQIPTGWAWAFPSAAQSSKRMAANFGIATELLERASF